MAVRIGITGATGRMGRELVRLVAAGESTILSGATDLAGAPGMGENLRDETGASLGVRLDSEMESLFVISDVVIDFTAPEATLEFARLAADTGTALVIGTTGLTAAQQARIEAAAESAPVLQAANFSLGIAVMRRLVEQAAAAMGPEFDIEILEMHHNRKIDAPSGTALALGNSAAKGRGLDLEQVSARGRDGVTGPRGASEIGFAALRGGDVAGEHSVIFAGPQERLELTHRAGNRTIFARGAIAAATWLAGQPPGLYSMEDMLA